MKVNTHSICIGNVWEDFLNYYFQYDPTVRFKFLQSNIVELEKLYLFAKDYFKIHWLRFEKKLNLKLLTFGKLSNFVNNNLRQIYSWYRQVHIIINAFN